MLGRLVDLAEQYYEKFLNALRDHREGRKHIYAVERLAQILIQVNLEAAGRSNYSA